jgi:hypothetical protein
VDDGPRQRPASGRAGLRVSLREPGTGEVRQAGDVLVHDADIPGDRTISPRSNNAAWLPGRRTPLPPASGSSSPPQRAAAWCTRRVSGRLRGRAAYPRRRWVAERICVQLARGRVIALVPDPEEKVPNPRVMLTGITRRAGKPRRARHAGSSPTPRPGCSSSAATPPPRCATSPPRPKSPRRPSI